MTNYKVLLSLPSLTIIILAVLDLVDALLPYLGVPITGRTAMVLHPFSDAAQEEQNKTYSKLLRLHNVP